MFSNLIAHEPTKALMDFKELIDSLPSQRLPPRELTEQYDFYQIQTVESGYSSQNVVEILRNRIDKIFTESDNKINNGRDLLRELFLRNEILNEDFSLLIDYLTGIFYYKNKTFLVSFDNQIDWFSAIFAIRDLLFLENTDLSSIKQIWFKDYQMLIKASKFLMKKGYKCELNQEKLQLSISGESKFSQEITAKIKLIGGLNYAKNLFERLLVDNQYNHNIRHYTIHRTMIDNVGTSKQLIPYSLLIQLAVKTCSYVTIQNKKFQKNVFDLEELAFQYGILLEISANSGVFGFSHWDNIIQKLRELMLYNTVFLPKQLSPTHAVRILEGLYTHPRISDTKLREKHGWGIQEAIRFAWVLAEYAPGFHEINTSILGFAKGNLSDSAWQHMLETFCHKQGNINNTAQPFTLIHQSDHYRDFDFFKKPLIKLNNGKIILLEPTLCLDSFNFAFFNALVESGVEKGALLTNLGYATEDFVVEQFNKHGILTHHGKHANNGETDVLVETEETIFLFEVKKTQLSTGGAWGNDIHLLGDLGKGFIKSQTQLLRAEEILLKDEEITLTDKQKVTIPLKNREIFRLTITLHDFGALHEVTIARKCLFAFANSKFESQNPKVQERVSGINSESKKLAVSMRKTVEFISRPETITAEQWEQTKWEALKFETQFLSLPFLLLILDHSSNSEEFRTELFRSRNLSHGIHDPTWSWVIMRHIAREHPAPHNPSPKLPSYK